MTSNHHRVHYLELQTTDMAASKRFYASVFGWTFADYGADYAAFENAGIEGGLTVIDSISEQPPAALVVFYSDTLDATEAMVRDAGGAITTPTFEFPGGRRFHLREPGGLELAVWSQ